jgi:hypothetical protein
VNYAALSASIQAYTENDFPDTAGTGGLTSTEQIDTFIQQAEQRIYSTVQLLEARKSTTLVTIGGNANVNVPADWLATFSLAVITPVTGEYTYLLNKDENFIRESFPVPATTGSPTHYAMPDATKYLLGPTPDVVYSLALQYYYYPESIVTAGTSWLGDNFDSVLLYGSLLEAYTFMKGEPDVIAEYQKRYDEALSLLKELGEGKNRQDMYRTPQVRYPVK